MSDYKGYDVCMIKNDGYLGYNAWGAFKNGILMFTGDTREEIMRDIDTMEVDENEL